MNETAITTSADVQLDAIASRWGEILYGVARVIACKRCNIGLNEAVLITEEDIKVLQVKLETVTYGALLRSVVESTWERADGPE